MFVGISKNFWGLQVSFFTDFNVVSKKLHQVTLFHTTSYQKGLPFFASGKQKLSNQVMKQ